MLPERLSGRKSLSNEEITEEKWYLSESPGNSPKDGPWRNYFVVLIILLVAGASYGLGRLSKIESSREPITIERWDNTSGGEQVLGASTPSDLPTVNSQLPTTNSGQVVASKNGTKYHLPWCPGAGQIKEENKIWFDSREAAEKAGYTPAANCKGL